MSAAYVELDAAPAAPQALGSAMPSHTARPIGQPARMVAATVALVLAPLHAVAGAVLPTFDER